jgi:DNA-binding response OmpR family regulator
MFKILVAEDDQDIRRFLCTVLSQNGYEAISAKDGDEALEIFGQAHVDLLILDLMMPGLDGFALAKALRDVGRQTPIIVVSAKESIADKARAFGLGVDDYMVKPVDEEELLMRIKALLRRSGIVSTRCIELGSTRLLYDSFCAECGDRTFEMPKKEFQILFRLLSMPGKIFTRRDLMDELWAWETESEERTVDVHINRLRERFKDNPDFTIVTVRGLGYKAVRT